MDKDEMNKVLETLQSVQNATFTPQLQIRKSFAIQAQNKQVRFPKSKKKRIRKKWRKDKNNYKDIETGIHDKANNIIYLSEKMYNTYLKTK